MSRVYDNWEKLVAAVLKREKLREIALFDSFSSSISADFSTRFSFASSHEDVSATRASSEVIGPEDLSSPSNLSYHYVPPIEFKELKKATKFFRPDLILGQGVFGPVFKGWIDEHTLTASKPGSGMPVAVKKCNYFPVLNFQEDYQGYREFSNELHYLSQLHHPNLIELIGYCFKEENRILVYELMPKGSLDNHLFTRGHQSLSWETRIKVAIDAARALSFLHDLEKPVIHPDFKTAVVLLDGVLYLGCRNLTAKLSQFGLAKDGPTGNMTHVSTKVMGTYGYAAPEYIATGHLTAKCDVFSFGVFLLELLSGRRVIDINRASNEQNLADWAMPYLHNKRKLLRVMDPKLEGQYPHNEAYNVATIALQCLSTDPKRRPKMAEVLVALLERL